MEQCASDCPNAWAADANEQMSEEINCLYDSREKLREAAKNLLSFVRKKYEIPDGEPFRCPYFNKLEEAVNE